MDGNRRGTDPYARWCGGRELITPGYPIWPNQVNADRGVNQISKSDLRSSEMELIG